MAGYDRALVDDTAVAAEAWPPPMKLLPGENPESLHVRDALRWIRTYRELQRLSDTDLSRPARGSIDQELLEDEAHRVGARLTFWKSRRDFLATHQRWAVTPR